MGIRTMLLRGWFVGAPKSLPCMWELECILEDALRLGHKQFRGRLGSAALKQLCGANNRPERKDIIRDFRKPVP
jgi:hypothetical protein